MLLKYINLRFGPSIHFSCMKFERFHQTIKNFTRHSNFINVGKSIAEKYVQKLELEFSGLFDFLTHPILQPDIITESSDGCIKSVVLLGLKIKNSPETIIVSKKKCIMQLNNITENDNCIYFHGKVLDCEFNHELLAYKIRSQSHDQATMSIGEICFKVGHIFNARSSKFVFFKNIY